MRELWVRNLVALCAAQLLTLIGFSAYFPFIPFFFQELGVGGYERRRRVVGRLYQWRSL